MHDSLHTYNNMSFEFNCVKEYMGENSVIVADNVDVNRAFCEFTSVNNFNYALVRNVGACKR